MVSVSVLGFEKFASRVGKIGTCLEICEKNVTIWASRKACAPKINNLWQHFHHSVVELFIFVFSSGFVHQRCLKFVQDFQDCLKSTPEAKVSLPVVVFVRFQKSFNLKVETTRPSQNIRQLREKTKIEREFTIH